MQPTPVARPKLPCLAIALALGFVGACKVAEPDIREGGTGGAGGTGVDVSRAGGAGGSNVGGGPVLPPSADGGATIPQPNGSSAADGGSSGGQRIQVYAHSATDLYQIDPESLSVMRVGRFFQRTPSGGMMFITNMTDLAIDKDGKMFGVTFSADLMSIDSMTAECTRLSRFNGTLNGLSWIRTDDGKEVLAATGLQGEVLRIDPMTGQATPIGNLGDGLQSSGDLVSVDKYGTLITVTGGDGSGDLLARVNPVNGVASIIGATKFHKVWGLGFWGNRVFGFTPAGEFILIDPKTGEAKLVNKNGAYAFWGAAVSTSAPVIVD